MGNRTWILFCFTGKYWFFSFMLYPVKVGKENLEIYWKKLHSIMSLQSEEMKIQIISFPQVGIKPTIVAMTVVRMCPCARTGLKYMIKYHIFCFIA